MSVGKQHLREAPEYILQAVSFLRFPLLIARFSAEDRRQSVPHPPRKEKV